MAKSIKELKKENAFLKGKCDKSDVTLIELAEEVILSLINLTLFDGRKLFNFSVVAYSLLNCLLVCRKTGAADRYTELQRA